MSVLSKTPICLSGILICSVIVCSQTPLPAFSAEAVFSGNERIKSLPPSPASEIARVFENAQAPEANQGVDMASTAVKKASSKKQVDRWIEQLGSTQFAQRERATAGLRAAGREALGSLKEAAVNYDDPEVRMRAADVARGIIQGETAGRIDAFLAGKDVGLEGWPIAQRILGDGLRVRELYVDLVMRHEDVAESLMGSSSDRAQALRAAITRIQRGMFVEQRVPTESDAIALLLMVNDRKLEVNPVDEGALFSVLRKEASSLLFKDPQLSPSFRQLLGGWMTRRDVSNRQEMLWFSMHSDLQEASPLAISTLVESNDPATLSMAAQAASRFGSVRDIVKLKPLLDDDRGASEQQYTGGTIVQAQVRDAAMAAIILISRKKLSEFGLNDDALHPKYGFITQEIGFPVDDPNPRQAALQKVKSEILGEPVEEQQATESTPPVEENVEDK